MSGEVRDRLEHAAAERLAAAGFVLPEELAPEMDEAMDEGAERIEREGLANNEDALRRAEENAARLADTVVELAREEPGVPGSPFGRALARLCPLFPFC